MLDLENITELDAYTFYPTFRQRNFLPCNIYTSIPIKPSNLKQFLYLSHIEYVPHLPNTN